MYLTGVLAGGLGVSLRSTLLCALDKLSRAVDATPAWQASWIADRLVSGLPELGTGFDRGSCLVSQQRIVKAAQATLREIQGLTCKGLSRLCKQPSNIIKLPPANAWLIGSHKHGDRT